jgi:hypothetical protein
MTNYYDVVVNTARMLGKYRATKTEIAKLAKRMFGYCGKTFDEKAFSTAFTQFRRSSKKNYSTIFA